MSIIDSVAEYWLESYPGDKPEYGTVTFDGVEYVLDSIAEYSNRVFPGWWGDADEGESYVAEFSAAAHDSEGNDYAVYWQFAEIKGQEPEDLGLYPWQDVNRVVPQ